MTVSDLHRTSTALPALVSEGLTYRDADGSTVEYAHLDHGATTPAFAAVAQEVAAAAVTYSSVRRGAGFASRVTSSRYEAARETVAAFVGARTDDHVVFTRNTTDSFNLLARALPTGEIRLGLNLIKGLGAHVAKSKSCCWERTVLTMLTSAP